MVVRLLNLLKPNNLELNSIQNWKQTVILLLFSRLNTNLEKNKLFPFIQTYNKYSEFSRFSKSEKYFYFN